MDEQQSINAETKTVETALMEGLKACVTTYSMHYGCMGQAQVIFNTILEELPSFVDERSEYIASDPARIMKELVRWTHERVKAGLPEKPRIVLPGENK